MYWRSFILLLSSISLACVDHAPTDSRTFHCEVLDNGLTLLLVEDPNATESAAAMYVDVGSSDDPEGREGLAHFLEHMLFISTKEYPKVDSLSEYVSSHGGGYNAFTGGNRTQYFFSVKPEYFTEGFKIFSSFFIEPLFEEEYVDRERHAVNAEFIVSKESDGWREYNLMKSLLSKHPSNRFSTGNLDTLQMKDLRQDLVDFYKTHYSSDQMYFVSVVPSDMQKVLPQIKDRLSLIEKRETKSKDLNPRFAKEDLGRVIQYKPIDDIDYLDIDFVLPSGKKDYLRPSARYISALVGDEGPGSIIDALRNADLALGLSAGVDHFSEVEDIFSIHIKLTKKGVEEKDRVMSAVMSYINMIAQKGVEKFRFEEMKKVSNSHYLYYNQQPALAQVNELVSNMKDYPPNKWFNVHYILDDSQFDAAHIQSLLSDMRLDNALITLVSKSVDVNQVEPIYGAEYSVSYISNKTYESWNSVSDLKLSLPKPNIFIPDNMNILDIEDTEVPIQITEASWYKHGKFKQPKQYIAFAKVLPAHSVSNMAHLMLVTELLEQEKMSSLYSAIAAGGFINIGHDEQGIIIEVGGMGDKQALVLDQTIQTLYNLEKVSNLLFEQAKEHLLSRLDNIGNEIIYKRLGYQLSVEINPHVYDYREIISSLEKISIHDFKQSLRQFLTHSVNQAFYYGNIEIDRIKKLSRPIEVEYSAIILPVGDKVMHVPSPRSDHGVMIYQQMEGDSDRDQLCISIIAEMIKPHFFKQLRTEEQMGYVVTAQYKEINRWPGIIYLVQSPNINSQDIKSRIETFLKNEVVWDEMSFNSLKASMIIDLDKPFETMGQEFGFYWNEIHSGQFDYGKKERLKLLLEKLTLADIEEYYAHIMANSRQLSLISG